MSNKYITGLADQDYKELSPGGLENFRRNYDIHDIALGLDLGQSKDYSALSIVRRTIRADDHRSGMVTPDEIKYLPPIYNLIYTKRFRLHTSYVDICRDIKGMLNEQWPGEMLKPYLVLDYGGPGRAVLDIFREEGLSPIGIHSTGGDRMHWIPGGYSVPKRDLVGVLQATLQRGELKIPKTLPEKKILLAELANFKIKITDKGNDTYEHAKSGDHDDMVMSLALAVYWLYLLRQTPTKQHSMIRKLTG